ncbi:hypothetical protein FANTH_4413 [Fusarium anthophilum]|uniref:Zn(2)-C6 fungal-type domain-containing protein n=1 Tax=Fusarium anthophilum TaxID=48485 RepID=A0A8H4ZQW9_9HYPO|nr:hypothetical protein FANTH_4413 [Fusarium anthophilum]
MGPSLGPRPQNASFINLWSSESSPADVSSPDDKGSRETGFVNDGSIVRIVDLPPHSYPHLHRSISLEYIIVLSGTVELVLDDGSSTMVHQGELVIQQATMHGWENATDEWARILCVMLPAKPPVIGGEEMRPDLSFMAMPETDKGDAGRSAIACANCARTKTKCDREHPCGRCRAKGLTCVSRRSRRGKAGKASTTIVVAPDSSPSDSLGQGRDQSPVCDLVADSCHLASPTRAREHQPRQSRAAESVSSFQELGGQPGEAMRAVYHHAYRSPDADPIHRGTVNDGLREASIVDINMEMQLDLETRDWEEHNVDLGWLPQGYSPLPAGTSWPVIHVDATTPTRQGSNDGQDGEAQIPNLEHWSICQCNPRPQYSAKDMGKSSIIAMEQNFMHPGSWSDIIPDWRLKHFDPAECFTNVPLLASTREWMVVIVQKLMHVAMDVHDLTGTEFGPSRSYIRLPPTHALQNYLEIVLRNCEPFYPTLPARILDPYTLIDNESGPESSLLLFLMLAFGSMIDPAPKARRFSTALMEVCRHSMRGVLELDPNATKSTLTAYQGFMFTLTGSFSGDKAHMNIATAHRHLYHTYMRSAGMFRAQHPAIATCGALPQSMLHSHEDTGQSWQLWLERQSLSRLVYSWVMLEHEISLFYGCNPALSVSELEVALPADDNLWLASSANEWKKLADQSKSAVDLSLDSGQQTECSLRDLFQLLKDDQLDCSDYRPRVLHMRLLLYPIYIQTTELSQLLNCVSTSMQPRSLSGPVTRASSIIYFEETHTLLQRWYQVFEQLTGQGTRLRAMYNATMALYHLTSLQLLTNFDAIEAFARRGHSDSRPNPAKNWFRSPEHALMHCGQLFRLFNEIEDELQPVWRACAIYRATMIMWAFGIWSSHTSQTYDSMVPTSQPTINACPMNDPSIQQYLVMGHPDPQLITKSGNQVSMSQPSAVLYFGIEHLDHGPLTTKFTLGVKSKLEAMSKVYQDKHHRI